MATAPVGTIWGAYDYPTSGTTTNGIRVGVYITWSGNASGSVQSDSISAVATIKIYTENKLSYSDLQTLTYTGGAISGSTVNFNNNSAGAGDQVERATTSYTYNYTTYGSSPGNITITATLSGAITGVTPFVTTVQAIPARPGGVPSAPTSVTSTPGNATVSIGFGAPSTNDPPTSSYQWSNDNASWGTIATNPFSVSGTNGTAKTVYVRAVNAAGAGTSASATSTPRTVPDALSFSATPINGNLTIAYSAPSFDGGTAVTSYQYSTNAGSTWTTTPSNPFNVSGSNGTAITVYMRAVNAAGNGPATSVTETPRTVPSAPQSFAGDNATFGQITLSWAAPSSNGGNAVSSYVLRTGATVLQNTGATSYVHTGLSAYTDYSYTVTAANAAGESTTASITVKSMGGVVNVRSSAGTWIKVVPQVRNSANTAWVTGQARARNNSTSEWKYGT